jgi:hypothetical protein
MTVKLSTTFSNLGNATSFHSQLLELPTRTLTLLFPQLLSARDWPSRDSLLATKGLERIVEDPFCRVLNGLVEHVW